MAFGWIWVAVACAPEPQPERPQPTTPQPEPEPPAIVEPPEVRLNEVVSANDSVWQAPDGPTPDAFELVNLGAAPVELGRLTVRDGSGGEWVGSGTLEAGAFLVVAADDTDAPGHAPFGIGSDGDRLVLSADGVPLDEVEVPPLPDDVVYAWFDGGWAPTVDATFGEGNPGAPSASLDPSDALFGDDHLSTFAITVDPAYEAALDVQFGEGVPGRLTYDGVTLDVQVKLKGSGSWQDLSGKPPWKLDLNAVVPGQRLRGLEGITLNNGDHDPTFAREVTTYEAFAAAGIPAPRVGWARVTYNGEDYGLYVHVETIDDEFLRRWYPDPTGMLLEGTMDGDVSRWELLELEEGALDEGMLTALDAVLADPYAADALPRLEALVDLDAFLTYAAVEALALHWDGYQKPKNYHVYLDPTDGRLEWLPHGTDWTWIVPNSLWHGEGAVYRFCLEQPACVDRYAAAVRAVADAFELQGAPERFAARSAWLRPEILADPRNVDTEEVLDGHVALTAENLAARADALRSELDGEVTVAGEGR
ncbi:MAG: CotH kinase family protein [Myxococcota bacterium]